jgi:hypothetical protein
MIHYDLTPAMISEHLTCLQIGEFQNLWKDKIEATKKARLTKMYNKMYSDIKAKDPKANK